ncbi:MAG TPA: YCF48-related protein [Candidatus Sulfotelmatobacter sp.]|nr:YCF48-related protein [Candidatus Sulfotelmatobacter sp.]
MRSLLWLLFSAATLAQSGPRIQTSHTTENLRGVSVVSQQVAWASGTHGTFLRTVDGGQTWTPAQVPDASTLDFRAVVAFSADEAFLMSAGPGDQSRIYHTSDGGQHWQVQFTNSNPKGFFDSMIFWNPKHGLVLGDPIPDESGKLHFELLESENGQNWHPIPPSQIPEALVGEGAFAASNSGIAIPQSKDHAGTMPSTPDSNIWFASGGRAARVFHSSDSGKTWQVFDTPILQGPESAGIFSIAFRDARHGVIAGGDYKHPDQDGPNLAFTADAGKTWTLSTLKPQAFFSAVAYDQQVNAAAMRQEAEDQSEKGIGKKLTKAVAPQRLFIIGEDFIFDFRPPNNPRRINGKKKQGFAFNAVSPLPEGGALVVGPRGTIAYIP